jgi:hypothetical protein
MFSLSEGWDWYHQNRRDLAPLITLFGSLVVGLGTIAVGWLVARAALRQAEIARERHAEQTKADQQRRITESFGKAVEHLADSKMEARLGGIYTLERIYVLERASTESSPDYWTVMEILTAFVRERAQWIEGRTRWIQGGDRQQPPADIAAVLAVIVRRPERERNREPTEGWLLNLSGTDLRGANLIGAHLEGANLHRTHLERATLFGAYLERAALYEAHFEGAVLVEAHFEGTAFQGTHLEGANLTGAHLQGADLRQSIGDAKTILPDGFPRPSHWPAYEP